MRLVKPSFAIEFFPKDVCVDLELIGRTCYKSENVVTGKSAGPFVRKLVRMGHWSVIEHATATVKFVVDRGVSHELVRHRLASYSQESTRYCDYKGGVCFVIPTWCSWIEEGVYGHVSELRKMYSRSGGGGTCEESVFIWLDLLLRIEEGYRSLRSLKISPQTARGILPNSLKTEIVMTANFREWFHVFNLRCSMAAHPQMREIMIPLREEFSRRCPEVFEVKDS